MDWVCLFDRGQRTRGGFKHGLWALSLVGLVWAKVSVLFFWVLKKRIRMVFSKYTTRTKCVICWKLGGCLWHISKLITRVKIAISE